MFDDAEGFFGLEEIDGVDVVYEGDMVKFVSATLSYLDLLYLANICNRLLISRRRTRATSSKGSTMPQRDHLQEIRLLLTTHPRTRQTRNQLKSQISPRLNKNKRKHV